MAVDDKLINVAIVGGGMAGLVTAIGLLKHSHIKVQVYEAATKFEKVGAGIALGVNALRAIKLIDPRLDETLQDLLTRHEYPGTRNMYYQYKYGCGEREGEAVSSLFNEVGQTTIHRATFLESFVKFLPKDSVHFGKRLAKIQEIDNLVKLSFEDGTSATADCVVGSEGIKSVVRKYILGEDSPYSSPTFSQFVVYRQLHPMTEAVDAMGEFEARSSHLLAGQDGFCVTYPVDYGDTLNVAVLKPKESWDGPWVRPVNYEEVAEHYKDWGNHAQSIIKTLDAPGASEMSIWHHPETPTYCKNNIVIIGDAAHASTPFQGAGVGQGMEDAYVLESILGHIHSVDELPNALKAFDKIRRHRAQRVVKTSLEAGKINALQNPKYGEDPEAWREELRWRWDWIWHHDVSTQAEQAVVIFDMLMKEQHRFVV